MTLLHRLCYVLSQFSLLACDTRHLEIEKSLNQFLYQVEQFGKISHWSKNDLVNINLFKTECIERLWERSESRGVK
jgi:hypothetical protein